MYDQVVYADSNVEFLKNYSSLFEIESGCQLKLFRHPARNTVIEELNACVEFNKITRVQAIFIKKRYSIYLNSTADKWLAENRIFYRDNNSRLISSIFEFIWTEFELGVIRDQVILPYACKKFDFNPSFYEFIQSSISNIYPHKFEKLRTKIKYYLKILFRAFN